ncbi:MAG: hypothetical protein KDD00_11455 [Ignavibacteriae bacterium]|nr:hypothetical protein [Ignavibacteriota bacterium]
MFKDRYNLLIIVFYVLALMSFYFMDLSKYSKVIFYITDFILCFILGFLFFIRNKDKNEFTFKEILFIAITLRIILLFVNPVTSDDYYRYLWDGRVQAEGLNPFQYSPEELTKLQDDVIYPKVTYPDIKTIYPPLSQVVFYLGYIISGVNTIGLKILYLFFSGGILYFLFNSLKLLKVNTNYIFLYVLSPLVIFEFFINAHIDILILFFISAFIYFTLSGNTGPAFLFLSLSILSKTYSLIFLPVYVFHLYRSGMSVKNIFLQSFYFFLPMLFLTFYGSSIGNIYITMQNYMQHWYSNNLIFVSLNSLLNVLNIYDHQIARVIMIIFFLTAYVFILRSKLSIIQKLYLVSFFYLFFAHTVHQWYVTLIVLFLPVCFSYSALYWSGIIGLTNITVFYFLRDNVWEDFMPVLIAEYMVLAVLIVFDIRRFFLPLRLQDSKHI